MLASAALRRLPRRGRLPSLRDDVRQAAAHGARPSPASTATTTSCGSTSATSTSSATASRTAGTGRGWTSSTGSWRRGPSRPCATGTPFPRSSNDHCARLGQSRPHRHREPHPHARRDRAGRRLLDGGRRQGRQPGAGGAARRGQGADVRRRRRRRFRRGSAEACCAADGVDLAAVRSVDGRRDGRRHDLRRHHGENVIAILPGANGTMGVGRCRGGAGRAAASARC